VVFNGKVVDIKDNVAVIDVGEQVRLKVDKKCCSLGMLLIWLFKSKIMFRVILFFEGINLKL